MVKRGVILISDLCPLCDGDIESVEHLFWDCAFSKSVFAGLLKWLKVPYSSLPDFANLFKWGNSPGFMGIKDLIFTIVLYTFIWAIWDWRNKKVFKNFAPEAPGWNH